jgi:hypothetical protein
MIVYEGRKPELHIKDDTLADLFENEFSRYSEKDAKRSKPSTPPALDRRGR